MCRYDFITRVEFFLFLYFQRSIQYEVLYIVNYSIYIRRFEKVQKELLIWLFRQCKLEKQNLSGWNQQSGFREVVGRQLERCDGCRYGRLRVLQLGYRSGSRGVGCGQIDGDSNLFYGEVQVDGGIIFVNLIY